MQNKNLLAFTVVGLAAAIAVPTIAFGNARNNPPGTNAAFHASQTPLVALMDGPSDLTTSGTITPTGDPDGTGSAAFTIVTTNAADAVNGAQVCFDLSYRNLTGTPVAAHIHRGAAGVGGPVVVIPPTLPNLTANSASGCVTIAPALADEILATPANFYINVHTSDFPAGAIRGQLSTGPAATGEAHMLPEPLRAYDSRATGAGGPLAINTTRTVSLASGLDGSGAAHVAVPAGATGAIVTLTVTNTGTGVGGAGGFLKLFSGAITSPPSISTINWFGGGQNLATTTQVAVDAAGQVNVFAGANQTDFIIDVIGYTF